MPDLSCSSSAAQLSKLSAKFNYNTDLALFRFGKKLYLFDDSGTMRFGWVHVKQATIIDMSSKGGTAPAGTIEDSLLYFDPKTGAAAAGGWKKVPAPMATESGISYGKEDLNIAVLIRFS